MNTLLMDIQAGTKLDRIAARGSIRGKRRPGLLRRVWLAILGRR